MKENYISKTIKDILFFIILILLTFYFILKDQDLNKLLHIIISANINYIILGIISMIIYFLIEAYNVRYTLNSLGEHVPILRMIKYTLICFFFNGITPAATGGEPMEIYYMTKDRIKSSNAILALLIQSCGFLAAAITFGIISAIINYKVFTHYLIYLFITAISISIIVFLVMIICIFSPKLMDKIIDVLIVIIKFITINKIKLSKSRFDKTISTYKDSSIFIKSHKNIFFKNVFRNYLQIIFFYLIPFFVYKSFGLSGHSIFTIISLEALLYSSTNSIPLPGSIGISEAVYLLLFGSIFGSSHINSAMLLSRGLSFYLLVFIGFIVFSINQFYLKKKR